MDNREIDALVAEKVMGWTVKKIDTSAVSSEDAWIDDEENIMAFCRRWNPTEKFEQAWQVAEEIGRKFECGVDVRILTKHTGKVWNDERWERKRYSATISGGALGYDTPNLTDTIYNDDVCAAICLTALKAVGVDITTKTIPTK